MFQDTSLANLPQAARPHSPQQAVRLLSRPAAQLNVREQEEIRLQLLASLYSPQHTVFGAAFCDAHYALPILMAQTPDVEQAKLLTTAWLQTGFCYLYNLLLITPEPEVFQQALEPLVQRLPEAAEHLCVRSSEALNPETIQEALAAYLPVQEPHLYFAFENDEAALLQAMCSGFLGLSTVHYTWQKSGFNSYRLRHGNSQELAKGLRKILDDNLDWELLQRTASQGQTLARQQNCL
ncbi:MAG: hypothetical protein ACO1RX_05320 [Candidatus Sericytochromatia bacterium]